jgi:hypothetical protein
MASKKDLAGDAIASWAGRVARSGMPWGEAWDQLTELERQVITVVHNAAITLRLAREGRADERDKRWLKQLAQAKADQPHAVKLATAAKIIAECAQRDTPSMKGIGRPDLADWGRLCAGMLASEVHETFQKLDSADVQEMLSRYTSTKNRKGGRLTESGILVGLNAKAGYPLGRKLTAKHVDDATRRRGT